jgi:hypothetical protein
VRRGGVVPPLAPLYHGPYKVLQAGSKFFTISLGGLWYQRCRRLEVVLHAVRSQRPMFYHGLCWRGPLWRTYSYCIIVVTCQLHVDLMRQYMRRKSSNYQYPRI